MHPPSYFLTNLPIGFVVKKYNNRNLPEYPISKQPEYQPQTCLIKEKNNCLRRPDLLC